MSKWQYKSIAFKDIDSGDGMASYPVGYFRKENEATEYSLEKSKKLSIMYGTWELSDNGNHQELNSIAYEGFYYQLKTEQANPVDPP